MTPLVIYHAGCDDGFTAAWIARKAMPDAEFRPYTYEMPAPPDADVEGRDVYVLDFSFKKADVERLMRLTSKLVVLDHHATAEAELKDLVGSPGLKWHIEFNREHSGAVLAWLYFNPGVEPPALVRYVQDRDLWKWELPASREFSAYLRSHQRTWEVWDGVSLSFADDGFADMAAEGAAVLRFQSRLVAELAARAVPVELFGYKTLLADAPLELHSEVGKVLADRTGTFGMCFAVRPADNAAKCVVQFGLRSVPAFDVAALATRLGGGGHKNAAGFERVSPFPVTDLHVACRAAEYREDPDAAAAVRLLGLNREGRRLALADLKKRTPARHKLVLAKMDELKAQAAQGGF